MIKEIKDLKVKLINDYTKKENYLSFFLAIISSLIIVFPLVLIMIQLFYLFLIRPYLLVLLTGLVIVIFDYLSLLFNRLILRNIKPDNKDILKKVMYYDFILSLIVISIIVLLLCLVFVPIFIL